MKKLFAIFTVVMFAVAANADVLFTETFSARHIDSKSGATGSTYVDKDNQDYYPYASKWFDGYTTKGGYEYTTNQYDNDYDAVASRSVTIRSKQVDNNYSVGLFFPASKPASNNYVKFEGALPLIPEGGAYLHFEVCSPETDGGDLDLMSLKVNTAEVNIPTTQLGVKLTSSTVTISLPAGQLDSLKFAFDNIPAQKFISKFWIEEAPAEGIENIMLTEKAHKVVVDGVVYIVRDGKMFNLTGTQVR